MRIRIFTILLLFSVYTNAQQLEPIISAQHGGSVTFIAMNFIDDALWVSGVQRDNGKGIIWKYNDNGIVLDSIVFSEAENQTFYNFVPYGDSIVVLGTSSPTNEEKLVIHCLDKSLNRIWTKTHDYEYNPYILGFRTFERFNKRFIAIKTPITQFFKLDKQFNVLTTKNMGDSYGFEPVKFTKRGFHFAKNGGWIVEIDTNFNEVDTLIHGYGFLPYSGNLMSDGKYGYINTSKNLNSHCFEINYRDSNYQVIRNYPHFGHQDENPRYTFYRTMLPNQDTTKIFASGLLYQNPDPHPVHLGSYAPNKFWVAYLNPDSLLWYRFYEDSIYYYLTINMTIDPDGSLYLAASRYNAAEQPDHSDAVIFKFNTEGDMLVGNKPEPRLQKAVRVYPNPGTNQLNIEIPEQINSTISLYNIQGKLTQSKQFHKKCQLNTEELTQGIYFYRIVTESGNIYTGKWVKK